MKDLWVFFKLRTQIIKFHCKKTLNYIHNNKPRHSRSYFWTLGKRNKYAIHNYEHFKYMYLQWWNKTSFLHKLERRKLYRIKVWFSIPLELQDIELCKVGFHINRSGMDNVCFILELAAANSFSFQKNYGPTYPNKQNDLNPGTFFLN